MAARTTGKTILVADDDLEVRSYFETILKIQGFDALLADSGEEALRILAESAAPISLAVIDVMMPGKDGIETLKEIRRMREDLPVILVSSACSWPFIMDALEGAPARFLEKPVLHDELSRTIDELLEETTSPVPEPPGWESAPAFISGAQPPRSEEHTSELQ